LSRLDARARPPARWQSPLATSPERCGHPGHPSERVIDGTIPTAPGVHPDPGIRQTDTTRLPRSYGLRLMNLLCSQTGRIVTILGYVQKGKAKPIINDIISGDFTRQLNAAARYCICLGCRRGDQPIRRSVSRHQLAPEAVLVARFRSFGLCDVCHKLSMPPYQTSSPHLIAKEEASGLRFDSVAGVGFHFLVS
jgi:hypothetical protein